MGGCAAQLKELKDALKSQGMGDECDQLDAVRKNGTIDQAVRDFAAVGNIAVHTFASSHNAESVALAGTMLTHAPADIGIQSAHADTMLILAPADTMLILAAWVVYSMWVVGPRLCC